MDFRQVLTVLRARAMLIAVVLIATVGTTVVVSLLVPNIYTASTSLVIEVKPTDPVVSGLLNPTMLMSPSSYLATQVDIIKSQRVALKVVQLLKLGENPDAQERFASSTRGKELNDYRLAGWLLRSLTVMPAREGSVVTVWFKADDPQFAATVANAFAEAYILTNLELRVDPARRTASWFTEQTKVLRDALEEAQNKLSRYQRQNGIVGSDERIDVETTRLSELSTQLVNAQGQTVESQNRERAARELLAKGGGADQLAEVMIHPTVVMLKGDISRAAAKLQELETRFGGEHPHVQQARAQLEEMRGKLAAEAENVARSLGTASTISQRREGEIRGAVEAQRRKLLDTKQKRDEMAVLMREVDSAQKAFDAVRSRAAQTSLESQVNQTTVSILNPAMPPSGPSSPMLFRNAAISVVLGIILAIGISFVLEMLDRRIRSTDDIKALVELPYLGNFSNASLVRRGRLLPEFITRRS